MSSEERFKTELETYEKKKAQLISEGNEGKFVLIRGDQVSVWGTYEDALREGYGRFGLNQFLVKQIQGIERVQFVTRDVPLCPN